MDNEIKGREIDDGREDVTLSVNGVQLVVLPQEGYRSIGMSYEQAKQFSVTIAQLMLSAQALAAKEGGNA